MPIEFSPEGGYSITLPLSKEKGVVQTDWWVLTGPPSSGKTTLVNELYQRGYKIVPETARVVIDEARENGVEAQELRADERFFQWEVAKRQREIEGELDPNELVFLDRAYAIDALTYSHLAEPPYDPKYIYEKPIEVFVERRYRGVFMFDALPHEQDYARTETPEQIKRLTAELLLDIRIFHGEHIRVPVLPIDERVKFILNCVRTAMPDMVEPPQLQPRLPLL